MGGCVRNDVLGVPINDVDIATSATPDQVIALCEAAALKVVPTGLDHGTVTVVVDKQGFEVTTFRQDVETNGRHAVVAFSKDLETDARRRDFTMNALYADREGRVFDPLGGLDDLKARRVRFIDTPEDRIREDGLRILRFFRFFAVYGDPDEGLDPEGLAACAALGEMLDDLSAERIGSEMRKLLAATDPATAVAAMAASGVLGRILPGAAAEMLAPLVHVEGNRLPRWQRRLSALSASGPFDRLRLSKAEDKALVAISQALDAGFDARRAGYSFGAEAAIDAGLIAASLSGQPLPVQYDEAATDGASLVFPVKARMLLDHLAPGPDVGAEMRRLEALWVASDFSLDRDALLSLSREG